MTKPLYQALRGFLFLLLISISYTASSQTDFLFIVDNSGSISPEEFDKFTDIIEATGQTLSNTCPNSEFAIFHYGGAFGQEYTIQNDFINWSATSSVDRVYVDCISSGTTDCGDDLPVAFGSIMTELGNGLNLTPGNDLAVVIFTDADGLSFAGLNMSPCTFAACSVLLPMTNFNSFISAYPAVSSYVIGVANTDNEGLLVDYVHGAGSYNAINLNDDPNLIADSFSEVVECEKGSIGLAKDLTSLTNNNDGTFTVEFLLTVENFATMTPLSNLEIFDDIVTQFSGNNPTNFTAINGSLTASSSWNGTAGSNILTGGQGLTSGMTGTVSIEFDISHDGPSTTIENTAIANGTDPDNNVLTDDSTDGLNPDPNGDGSPTEDTPTPVLLPEIPVIGLAKNLTDLTDNNDGTYTVEFLLTAENLSTSSVLNNLIINDDVVSQFSAFNPSNFMTISGSLNGAASWNGTAGSNIVQNGQSIAAGQTETISIKFDLVHSGDAVTIFNSATIKGTGPNGVMPTDTSEDGLNPDPNGDGNPDENSPTPVLLPETPVIGLAKSLTSLTDNSDGTFTVEFLLTAENLSTSSTLNNLIFNDDIVTQFSAFTPSNFMTLSGSLNGAASWNGTAGSNIVQSGQSIAAGQTETISIKFDLVHEGDATTILNTATIEGTDPNNRTVTDTSHDGVNPDPNNDGNPSEDDPTPVLLPAVNPTIGLAKNLTDLVNNMDGTYSIEFLLTVENFSFFALTDLEIFDDIVGQFSGYMPTNYTVINGSLSGNSSWDGTANSNILSAGQSISIGATENISIKFDITPTGVMSAIFNSATAKGTSPSSEVACDTSYDGLNPDPNNDDDPGEEMPTPVVLPEFSMISGTVFKDQNANGLNNPGDSGIFSVTVQLRDCTGNVIATTSTDMNGNYAFSNLFPSNYEIYINPNSLPLNCEITAPNVGTDDTIDSDILMNGRSQCISVSTDEDIIVDAGFFPNPPVIGLAKSLTSMSSNMDGSYTVEFLFNVENFSNFALSDLQILDDVASQFVGYMPSNFSVIDGSLTGNPSWNGGATTNILAAGQSIAVGVVEDISV